MAVDKVPRSVFVDNFGECQKPSMALVIGIVDAKGRGMSEYNIDFTAEHEPPTHLCPGPPHLPLGILNGIGE